MNEIDKYNVPLLIIFKAFLIRALMSHHAEKMAWIVFVIFLAPIAAFSLLLVVRLGWQIAFLF